MTRALRLALVTALAVAAWPEFARYRAEWQLGEATARMERVLRGTEPEASAVTSVQRAEELSRQAIERLPADPRPVLIRAIALIMTRRLDEATALLDAAIAQGERPEFTINLGRARAARGDEAGAHRAYLRTAWTAPSAIGTLPKAMQRELLEEVGALEGKLRTGELKEAPPL